MCITDNWCLYYETLEILDNFKIKNNIHRCNASGVDRTVVWGKSRPTKVNVGVKCLSQNFGLVQSRFGTSDGLKPAGKREGNNNEKYPEVYKQLQELIYHIDPQFEYNAITVNKNFRCLPHKDKYNIKPSLIIALGDYTGGELNIEGAKFDINWNPLIFNGGKLEHSTEEFDGDRYSIVYYSI